MQSGDCTHRGQGRIDLVAETPELPIEVTEVAW
jgi:hypothetical protein